MVQIKRHRLKGNPVQKMKMTVIGNEAFPDEEEVGSFIFVPKKKCDKHDRKNNPRF